MSNKISEAFKRGKAFIPYIACGDPDLETTKLIIKEMAASGAEYAAITDDEAVNAFEYLSRQEGIIPAIESAHAPAYAMKLAPKLACDKIIVVTLSGSGDKDCAAIARYRSESIAE